MHCTYVTLIEPFKEFTSSITALLRSKLLIVSCHPGITVLFEVVAIAVEVAE